MYEVGVKIEPLQELRLVSSTYANDYSNLMLSCGMYDEPFVCGFVGCSFAGIDPVLAMHWLQFSRCNLWSYCTSVVKDVMLA